jgi:inosine/xanthosine triphosphate pyrophosphatase family protein
MPTILLATSNAAKQAKLRWLIDGLGYDAVTPRDLGLSFDPPESGSTHQEIAASKARAWADAAGCLAISSDGGIDIPALGPGWNSLYTRRAAGNVPDDQARADHLLGLMRGYAGADRDAFKREAVAVAEPGRVLGAWEAGGPIGRVVESYDSAHIRDGFWLPAVLWDTRFGKVVADLTSEESDQTDNGWNGLRGEVRPFLSGLRDGSSARIVHEPSSASTLQKPVHS